MVFRAVNTCDSSTLKEVLQESDGAALWTLNHDDFEDIPDLKLT
jgi:hypothetical protein